MMEVDSGSGNMMVGRVWWVKLKLLYFFFFGTSKSVVEGECCVVGSVFYNQIFYCHTVFSMPCHSVPVDQFPNVRGFS